MLLEEQYDALDGAELVAAPERTEEGGLHGAQVVEACLEGHGFDLRESAGEVGSTVGFRGRISSGGEVVVGGGAGGDAALDIGVAGAGPWGGGAWVEVAVAAVVADAAANPSTGGYGARELYATL